MPKLPLVSIIIPTYNRKKNISHTIDSILDQNFKDYEIIIIDDGSTDKTYELIKHCYFHKKIHYFYQNNQGVSAARNKGILEAKGKWLAFLDSDDRWLPDKLQTQLNLTYNEKTLWCHTGEIWIRNNTRVNAKKIHKKHEGRIYLPSLPLCTVSPSSVLIHKSIFHTHVGFFDTKLPAAEDYDLWLRISSQFNISLVHTPQIYKYGGHSDQLSNTFLGLDRFRVRALLKHLNSSFLNKKEKNATKLMLIKKTEILFKGYKKHNKLPIYNYYKSLFHKLQQHNI